MDQYGFVLPGNVLDRLDVLLRQYDSLCSTGSTSSSSSDSEADGRARAAGSTGGRSSRSRRRVLQQYNCQPGVVCALRRDAVTTAVTRLLRRWGCYGEDDSSTTGSPGTTSRAGGGDGENGGGAADTGDGTGEGGDAERFLWLSEEGEEVWAGGMGQEGMGMEGRGQERACLWSCMVQEVCLASTDVLDSTDCRQGRRVGTGQVEVGQLDSHININLGRKQDLSLGQGLLSKESSGWSGVRPFFGVGAWGRRVRAAAATLVKAYPWRWVLLSIMCHVIWS